MSQTKRQFNKRKKKIALIVRKMEKEGYVHKKTVKNRMTFVHKETGKKEHRNIPED